MSIICKAMCETCIFRPDTPIPEARDRLTKKAVRTDGYIICHSTIGAKAPAHEQMCAGFAARFDTSAVRMARRLDLMVAAQ